MKNTRIGLALGGGAARGWSHIGVIEALAEHGIEPDVVAGCSIGAFVGAALVSGHIEDLEHWVCELDWREIVGMLDVRFSGGGLIQGGRMLRFLSDRQEDVMIESLPIPFGAVATDLSSGREVWLREGSMFHAVHASMALPGLLSPVRHDGRWLADGGLVNPVPVSLCRALGADAVIAVNLNGEVAGRRLRPPRKPRFRRRAAARKREKAEDLEPSFFDRWAKEMPAGWRGGAERLMAQLVSSPDNRPSYFDVIAESINIMQDQITRSRMAGDPPEVLLAPRLSDIRLMDFNRAEDAIEEGRACVRRSMPLLREVLDLPS